MNILRETLLSLNELGHYHRKGVLALTDAEQYLECQERLQKRLYSFRNSFKKQGRCLVVISSYYKYVDLDDLNDFAKAFSLDVQCIMVSADQVLSYLTKDRPDIPVILILNGNDPTALNIDKLLALSKLPNLSICLWDFDNHHAFNRSFIYSRVCDSYVAAHPDQLDLLALIRGSEILVEPCTSMQFPMVKLKKLLQSGRLMDRKKGPLGWHHAYSVFQLRTWQLQFWSSRYPDVGILHDNSYHHYDIANLGVWSSYATTVAVPTLCDVPIRLFDSLITGSIPIVPDILRRRLNALGVNSDWFVDYSVSRLDSDIDSVVESAWNCFESQGILGCHKRISYSLDNFHINSSFKRILSDLLSRVFKVSAKI